MLVDKFCLVDLWNLYIIEAASEPIHKNNAVQEFCGFSYTQHGHSLMQANYLGWLMVSHFTSCSCLVYQV